MKMSMKKKKMTPEGMEPIGGDSGGVSRTVNSSGDGLLSLYFLVFDLLLRLPRNKIPEGIYRRLRSRRVRGHQE
jgi:hypothetical protein